MRTLRFALPLVAASLFTACAIGSHEESETSPSTPDDEDAAVAPGDPGADGAAVGPGVGDAATTAKKDGASGADGAPGDAGGAADDGAVFDGATGTLGDAATADATDPDAGGPTVDSGNPVVDAGNPVVDSGNPIVDSGNPIVDAGNPVVDAGNPVIDAGNPVVDSGNPIVDSGNPIVDAGNPVVDAGNPVIDAGNPVIDAGGGGTTATFACVAASSVASSTGIAIDESFSYGYRFQVPAGGATAHRIGLKFYNYGAAGLIDGAIVRLASATAYPALDGSDAVASTTLAVPANAAGTSAVGTDVNVALSAGWYAVVFGSGKSGAAATGMAPDQAGTGACDNGQHPFSVKVAGAQYLDHNTTPYLYVDVTE